MDKKAKDKFIRAGAAKYGWFNWYVNRGRLSLSPTDKELRALSWRRVF